MAKKRITELATETTLKDGQYVAIDHTTDGTKKLNLGAELTDLKEDFETLETEVSTLTDAVTLSTYNNDKVPYLFRQSGGGKYIGGIEKDSIVGGTVAWNQLFPHGNMEDVTRWSTQSNATINSMTGNVLNVTFSADNGSQVASGGLSLTNGHKFLTTVMIKLPSASAILKLLGGFSYIVASTKATTDWQTVATVTGATPYSFWILRNTSGSAIENVLVKEAMIFDLTLLFGSTIADYIYSLEQATAGSGVAKLKSWGFFTDSYYPYDSGSLKSVESLTSHDVVGFNQWDEEWEEGTINTSTGAKEAFGTRLRSKNYIPILPNTEYCYRQGTASSAITGRACFYDADKNFISGSSSFPGGGGNFQNPAVFTTPNNAYYMMFSPATSSYTIPYKNDICINLSSSRNGQYEPYQKHSYALDSDLTLRGVPKLDSGNNLYYDGDKYASDGTVTRKYAYDQMTYSYLSGLSSSYIGAYTVTGLGDCVWVRNWNYTTAKAIQAGGIGAICNAYPISMHNATIFSSQNRVYFVGVSTVADFLAKVQALETAGSGLFIAYELETPTTETANPYQNPQIVDKNGTEEYVTTGIVPVGHDTDYYLDADSVLTPPSTAGTYSLKVTVASDGSKSYSWLSD